MAKILCVDDYPMYGELIGLLLAKKGGHEVRVESVPVSLKRIQDFEPDLIVINLVRKLETLSQQGITDFYADVEGARAFREIAHASRAGAIRWPIVVTALALQEHDMPRDDGLDYLAFVEIPQRLDKLLMVVAKVVAAKDAGSRIAPD